jgi:hypothetical protein
LMLSPGTGVYHSSRHPPPLALNSHLLLCASCTLLCEVLEKGGFDGCQYLVLGENGFKGGNYIVVLDLDQLARRP